MWTYDLGATTAVETAAAGVAAPQVARLLPVAPNPAAAGPVRVGFVLPQAADISVRIYTATGRLVRVLADGRFDAGEYTREWDGRDLDGVRAASGVYLVRLAGDGVVRTRKLTLVK
jgi:hypothetical protein